MWGRTTILNRFRLSALISLFVVFTSPHLLWAQAALDIPLPFSFQSGLRVITGWVCEASRVEIEIDGTAVFPAAYGAAREDTRAVCGDAENGFGLPLNWNLFGDGRHEVRALADGVEFARAVVRVVTLGSDFLSGVAAACTVGDFPQLGMNTQLRWEESLQNFAIVGNAQSSGVGQVGKGANGLGVLENPRPGSFHSGIGPLSGWVCEGEQVDLVIDDVLMLQAVSGIDREDTRAVCGDAKNGFGLAVNWNLLGDGEHTVQALADGEEFASATFQVTTLGEEFLSGGSGRCRVVDFPEAGTDIIVRWQQSTQNFVITDTVATEAQTAQVAGEPTIEELGLRLAPKGLNLGGLSPAGIDQVARGSYLMNGASDCFHCHTFPVDYMSPGYMSGGVEFPLSFTDVQGFSSLFTRNLTPDPETGLQLTEAEFIEAMRTGKDFHDSTEADTQRLLVVQTWPLFRFMSLADLKDMYAFLRRIPPVRNEIRKTFQFPLVSAPFPVELGDGDPINDPNNVERGFRILDFFSSGPEAETFQARFQTATADLTPDERAKVGRGSYLVNALGSCNRCHTVAIGFILGPGRVDVNTAEYLAGGEDTGSSQSLIYPGTIFDTGTIFSTNITPDPDTGLLLTEDEFIQAMRFGADFRRPGNSLRQIAHFPTEYHYILDDLKAIYAYLQTIPAVHNPIEIVP